MVIVPSLDVRAGRVADGSDARVADRARELVSEGAAELHLVDLDAAETGIFANIDVLADAARAAGVPCRLAGGVSRIATARDALARRFAGVLFSSAVFGDDDLLREIAALGDAAIVEIESRAGFLAPRGGDQGLVATATGRGVLASARAALIAGIRALYLIDVGTDRTLGGPPLALVDNVRAVVGPDMTLHAGGGVRDLDDLRALADRGIASVVVGRALAEGRFTIRDARRAILHA
jgi:phosphoribosylformimino-5-aminoimidazole carboxamide ribotide isomerase